MPNFAYWLFPGEGRGPVAMAFERLDHPNRWRRNWAPAFAGEPRVMRAGVVFAIGTGARGA